MVASPRNHLYRMDYLFIQGGPFCLIFNAELNHFGDLADDLDFQPCLGPADRYALDQAAEDLKGLIPNVWLIEGVLETLNLLAIDLRQVGAKTYRRCWTSGQVLLKLLPPRLEFVQPLL